MDDEAYWEDFLVRVTLLISKALLTRIHRIDRRRSYRWMFKEVFCEAQFDDDNNNDDGDGCITQKIYAAVTTQPHAKAVVESVEGSARAGGGVIA